MRVGVKKGMFLGILLGWMASAATGQIAVGEKIGLNGGLTFTFGTTVNRLGLAANAYWVDDFVQINLGIRGFYGFSHLGPRPTQPGWEWQASLGALAGFGPPREKIRPILSPVGNQTGRMYSLGYAFSIYGDQRKTSQTTGTFALELDDFQIITENDVFSGGIEDKFRTGTLGIFYRNELTEYGMKITLWTGNSRSEGVKRVRDKFYPSRNGYKDLRNAKYGRFSHGILTLSVRHAFEHGQVGGIQLGIDSDPLPLWRGRPRLPSSTRLLPRGFAPPP